MPLLFYSVFGSSARWRCGVTAILVIAAEPRIVAAQGGQPSCDGRRITTIQIAPERPSFKGSSRQWQLFARAIGLHHATTRADVVGAYLLFKRGEICADARLAESERILRALPFLADARVTASADSAGGVIVGVSTTDEIPVLVTGSLRHTVPAALSLGNENIGGLGLRMVAGGERGTVYRGAAHLEIADYALFGQPVSTNAHIERDFLGESGAIGVSQPFLSDFQRGAWQASYYGGHDFPIVLRPSGDNGAVELHQVRWSASGMLRTRFANTAALWGPVVFGARVTPTSQMLLITNSGAVPMTDSLVAPRLLPVRAVWLGGLFAMRRVNYMTRFGLDALFAPQDVMAGWETGLVAAPGVGARHDMLLATSTRAGFATARFAINGDLEAALQRGLAAGVRPSNVVNLNLAAYLTPTSGITFTVRDNFSRVDNAWLPTQLSLGDPIGGPRGYLGSQIAGGMRNVTRAELRRAVPAAIRGADAGAAAFFDLGQMWAGDVPYGSSTTAPTLGLSLLAAYPTRSKRVYRIDVAFPLRRASRRGIEIRFGNGDPSVINTIEPRDVTQLRVAPVPSSIFVWPERR